MSFTDEELERYARHIVLREIGGAGQARLKAARVVAIGAGGIGAPALLYLTAAGVGRIDVIDDDDIALSNLQRQVLFATGDIGSPKTKTAAARLSEINPHVTVDPVAIRIDSANAPALIAGAAVVLDGSDNFATRLAVADAAYRAHIPLVSAAIGQFHAQIGTWRGWLPDAPCYRCYAGDAFDAEDCDSCADLGVLGAMCGIIGSFAAMETIRAITPFGDDPTGKLHLFDGLAPSMRTIRMPNDPGCGTCGSTT